MARPLLSLDFDGVLHGYQSGWQGAHVVPDPPVPGAMRALVEYARHFDVAVFSSRNHQPGGQAAMRAWLVENLTGQVDDPHAFVAGLSFPRDKPPAFVALDDRALTFSGVFPPVKALLAFEPWNRA